MLDVAQPWYFGLALCCVCLAAPAASAQAGDVVVKGARSDHSTQDPSAASQVLRDDELKAPGASAGDALERVSGVEVSRSGAATDRTTLSLRGSTAAQVPVYLGPLRLNDEVTGAADLGSVPLWMLDRVEVFRGSTPARADAYGMGGAVFFEPKFPRRNSIGAGLGIGSFGEQSAWGRGEVSSRGAGGWRSGALVGLRLARADNDYSYVDDRGTAFDERDDITRTRSNADFSEWDAWAIGLMRSSRGARVLTLANAFSREQGVTGLASVPAQAVRSRQQRLLAGVSVKLPCGKKAVGRRCELELGTQLLDTRESVSDPLSELGIGPGGAQNIGSRAGQRLRLTWGAGPLELSGQADVARDSLRVRGAQQSGSERFSARPALEVVLRPDARASYALSGALPIVSTRSDARVSDVSAGSDGLEPEGRLGVAYSVTEHLSLLFNVGHFTRRPTLGELFGLSSLVRGNAGLVAERGEGIDFGVRAALVQQRTFSLAVESFGFARWSRDLIAYRRSTFGVVTPFNVATARVLGVESAFQMTFDDWLRWRGSLTLQDPRDTSDDRGVSNDLLPYHARLMASSRLGFYAPRGSSLPPSELVLATSYRSSKFADPAGLVVVPEQLRWDLEAAVALYDERLQLRGMLRNLFGSRQYDLLGQPQPGRSFHASAELVW
ncbi:MAG: TonB-dependent receptor [Polyangiaceae bacterium]|nr:TonB-dependent receptor [Polyangiaceae bacterium]